MNNSSGRVKTQAQASLVAQMGEPQTGEKIKTGVPDSQIPSYLQNTYWWAYIHPKAVSFFEKQWVINLILWGNFVRLRDKTLDELGSHVKGNTLQIACVYGDFSSKLAQRIADGGTLDIVDAVPIQLDNVRAKIQPNAPVRTIQIDSSSLMFADESYDQVVLFFLLHEMPDAVRRRTLGEAVRVLKPGGKLVIVDFHKPTAIHPLRYIYPIIFRLLEPFALDTWHQNIEDWLPGDFTPSSISKETLFGRLYQKLVIQK
jgi:ubiquinone/menaquinone biosynthesis C-methylase UbiE